MELDAQDMVKIESSIVLLGEYECRLAKPIELREEFLTLPLDKGSETLLLSLSFKHISKIELFDNSENQGAGMLLHVNDFMAAKIQTSYEKDGTKFSHYKSDYAPNRFIVFDILNGHQSVINKVLDVLKRAHLFHHNYVVQQLNKSKNNSRHMKIPVNYVEQIPVQQWIVLLSLMGKMLRPEQGTCHLPDGKTSSYTRAYIVSKPNTEFVGSTFLANGNSNKSNANLNGLSSPGSLIVEQQHMTPSQRQFADQQQPGSTFLVSSASSYFASTVSSPLLPDRLLSLPAPRQPQTITTTGAATRYVHGNYAPQSAPQQHSAAPQQKQRYCQHTPQYQQNKSTAVTVIHNQPQPTYSTYADQRNVWQQKMIVKQGHLVTPGQMELPYQQHQPIAVMHQSFGGGEQTKSELPSYVVVAGSPNRVRLHHSHASSSAVQVQANSGETGIGRHERQMAWDQRQHHQPRQSESEQPQMLPTDICMTTTVADTSMMLIGQALQQGDLSPRKVGRQSVSTRHQLQLQQTSSTSTAPSLINQPKNGQSTQKRSNEEIHLIDDEDEAVEKGSAAPPEKRTNDTLFAFPPTGGIPVHHSDLKFLARNFMLNDTIIDFYLKYIHHRLVPEEDRERIFIFNSFFFGRLTQSPPHGKPSTQVTMKTKLQRVQSNYQRVKSWTKKVNLFDMDYIVVPINEDIHWYLAIIVNVGTAVYSHFTKSPVIAQPKNEAADEGTTSSSDLHSNPPQPKKPFLIVLNSLIDPAEDKHIAVRNQLAEYLLLEYNEKHARLAPNTYFCREALEVVQPTMLPQQKNYVDCGLFLLHFAEMFLTKPPRTIAKKSAFRHWFPEFRINHKREEIQRVIKQLAPQVRHSDFIYIPTGKRKPSAGRGRRSAAAVASEKMQSIIDAFPLMGRTRRYSDASVDEIVKDEHFSFLYRPRSMDSLIRENKDRPVVVQPPTKAEMRRFSGRKDLF